MESDANYYPELIEFLKQAQSDSLRTKHYQPSFLGTDVKVSFGQGNTARIPWISFLIEPNKTSLGIYPVYLYYKEYDQLILAYGVSETNKPSNNWKIKNKNTIIEYFEEQYSKKPDRYGSSYVFEAYDINNLPSEEVINQDLKSIIAEYKETLNEIKNEKPEPLNVDFHPNQFMQKLIQGLQSSGLIYSDLLVTRFVASLLTKPFVILTGLSGSGKTKLAQAFVQWICQNDEQYCIVPVGADWTNREPLLGYPNALNSKEYIKPDSGVLDLLIRANNRSDLPHFLILDEMNLSHVERYFADFLSVMESKEDIPLFTDGTIKSDVPAKLKVPSNLFIIGTVNIDETTHMFSPKVLDRANTIEFRVTQDEMKQFLGHIQNINMDILTGNGAGMAKSFLNLASVKSTDPTGNADIHTTMIQFFGELKKAGAEFGYRSATEILQLIHQLTVLDSTLTTEQKIDIAIMQKLLPKLHGSRRKLSPVLEALGSFCISGDITILKDVFEKTDVDFSVPNVLYPISLDKITRMYNEAIDNGFASFAEA